MAPRIQEKRIEITPPKFEVAIFRIRGTAPYVQNKFSSKAREQIRSTQEAGSQSKKGKKREPKNFTECYEGAKHISDDGWIGQPAASYRCALIDACKIVGFMMTRAKLALFIEADGFDIDDGTPLVKITKGAPKYVEHYVRNETGVVDLRARPLWTAGWEAILRIKYDVDMFSATDIANLVGRAGSQVGIGEGRPSSKKSAGMGWGTFEIIPQKSKSEK